MRPSCLVWIVFGCLSLNLAQAGQFKLYHCKTDDGPVVVQDRPCAVTRMNPATKKSAQPNQRKARQANKPKHKPKSFKQAASAPIQAASSKAFIEIAHKNNWPAQLSRNQHGWHLSVDVPGRSHNQSSQVSVRYFKNPEQTLNTDAFSYALNLYHGIRHQYHLIDSQFKSHSAYKVFNIVYKKATQSAKSEFYISKRNGSLWVFSFESSAAGLAQTQRVMAQLQALI